MPVNKIPDRDPVGDPLTGSVLRQDDAHLLALIPLDTLPDDIEVVHQGRLIIRYGFRYFGKPRQSVVLGLLALDYGEMLTGDRAFETLRKQYSRYPRADVIGYRNDGSDEMTVAKNLDMDLPLHVLAYIDEKATKAMARIDAVIATETQRQNLPDRLLSHIPHYDTIADWQTHKDTHDKS